MKQILFAAALLISGGCQPNQTPQRDTAHADSALLSPAEPDAWTDSLLNRVWVSTDAAAPPGSMRIFLAGGTLLMDSCWEVYRLSTWNVAADSTLTWREDTAEIRARVRELGVGRLVLALELVSGPELQQFRSATVPFVCPEMPR